MVNVTGKEGVGFGVRVALRLGPGLGRVGVGEGVRESWLATGVGDGGIGGVSGVGVQPATISNATAATDHRRGSIPLGYLAHDIDGAQPILRDVHRYLGWCPEVAAEQRCQSCPVMGLVRRGHQ